LILLLLFFISFFLILKNLFCLIQSIDKISNSFLPISFFGFEFFVFQAFVHFLIPDVKGIFF